MTTTIKHIVPIAVIALLSLWSRPEAHAQYTEYEIKGSMITNIAKYVAWPEKAFGRDNKIVFGILGDDPFGQTIEDITMGRTIKGRSWKILRGTSVAELRGAHIVFIGKSMNDQIKEVLDEIYKNRRNASVLTVGDNIDNFCEYGGIMNYRPGQTKYRFDLNIEALTSAGLRVDVKLLNFANEIVPNDEIKP